MAQVSVGKLKKTGLSILGSVVLLLLYQNCGAFKTSERWSAGSSTGGSFGSNDIIPGQNIAKLADIPCVDGEVHDIEFFENKAYIGGRFETVGKCSGQAVLLEESMPKDGAASSSLMQANLSNFEVHGVVHTSIVDSNGGLYLGGSFTTINGAERTGLAHVTPQGELSSWAPQLEGQVHSLSIVGERLIVGGLFSAKGPGGKTGVNLVAYNITNGEMVDWYPNPNHFVEAQAWDEQYLYVAGRFTNIKDNIGAMVERQRFARFKLPDLSLDSASISLDNFVLTIHLLENEILLGGGFTEVQGESRQYLASLDRDTLQPNPWNPKPTSIVYSIYSQDDTVLVGGNFIGFFWLGSHISVPYLAAFEWPSGNLLDWNLRVSDRVYEIKGNGDEIYIGGKFERVNLQARHGLAVLDASTLDLSGKFFPFNNAVYSVSFLNSQIFVGGSFTSTSFVEKKHFAIFDLENDQIVNAKAYPFNGAHVNDIVRVGERIFVAGNFQFSTAFPHQGLRTYTNLIALDANSGQLVDWTPKVVGGNIEEMSVSDSELFITGGFSSIGGRNQGCLASYSLQTLELSAWDPGFDSWPCGYAIHVAGDKLYVGGRFTEVGGEGRSRFATFNLSDKSLSEFAPAFNSSVVSIRFHEGRLFVGGTFQSVELRGQQVDSRGIAIIDLASEEIIETAPQVDGSLREVVVANGNLYAVGNFGSVSVGDGTFVRRHFFAYSLNDSQLLDFAPEFDFAAFFVGVYDSSLVVSGNFNRVGGKYPHIGGHVFGIDLSME